MNRPTDSATLSLNVLLNVGLVAFLVVVGCSSKDNDSGGSKTAGSAGTGAQGTPSGGVGGQSSGGVAGNAAAGATGGTASLCPDDPGIMTCGSETCSEVADSLAQICVQNCCTSDMKCGTLNAVGSTACMPKIEDTSMCPAVTIVGMQVPGCCVPDETLCGVQDVSNFFGGGCIPRCMAAMLSSTITTNVNCDGTPAGECSTAGTGGMGGGDSGTSGTGGAGGSAED